MTQGIWRFGNQQDLSGETPREQIPRLKRPGNRLPCKDNNQIGFYGLISRSKQRDRACEKRGKERGEQEACSGYERKESDCCQNSKGAHRQAPQGYAAHLILASD